MGVSFCCDSGLLKALWELHFYSGLRAPGKQVVPVLPWSFGVGKGRF